MIPTVFSGTRISFGRYQIEYVLIYRVFCSDPTVVLIPPFSCISPVRLLRDLNKSHTELEPCQTIR